MLSVHTLNLPFTNCRLHCLVSLIRVLKKVDDSYAGRKPIASDTSSTLPHPPFPIKDNKVASCCPAEANLSCLTVSRRRLTIPALDKVLVPLEAQHRLCSRGY